MKNQMTRRELTERPSADALAHWEDLTRHFKMQFSGEARIEEFDRYPYTGEMFRRAAINLAHQRFTNDGYPSQKTMLSYHQQATEAVVGVADDETNRRYF